MPSSVRDAALLAAERLKRERSVDLVVYGKGDAVCGGELGPHADALFGLFSLAVDLAGRGVSVVLQSDRGWLHLRGEGIPRMGQGLAAAPYRQAMATEGALGAVDAHLVLDAGGFLVIYGKTMSAS